MRSCPHLPSSPAPRRPRPPARTLVALALAGLTTWPACKGCGSDPAPATADDGDTGAGDGGSTEVPAEYTHDWGQWLSMAVTPDDTPAVAYYDRTQGALGYAVADLSTDPVTWQREEVDGYTDESGLDVGDRGQYASMAIAADGTVWIAYKDALLDTLRLAWRDPATGTWESTAADGGGAPSGTGGTFASLALDATSHPVIVHYDTVNKDLRRVRYDGTGFEKSVVDEGADGTDSSGETVEADVGRFARIIIQDGVEYIAYYDAVNGDLKLAWGVDGDYTIEVVDDGGGSRLAEGGGDVGQWPDLVVQDGNLWITYHDVGNQDLMMATGVPGAWTVERVDEGEFVGADSAVFLNGTQPSIAYFDGRNNDMKLATRVGDGWQTEQVTGDQGALGFHNEVVLARGAYWAACYDYTHRTVWFGRLE